MRIISYEMGGVDASCGEEGAGEGKRGDSSLAITFLLQQIMGGEKTSK